MISHFMAYIFLVANMALWSGALVVARGVHEIAPPMALTFWRWVVTALILFPFIARNLRKELPLKPEARHSVYWICVTMSVGTTLSLVAVNHTTAINAAVINGVQPAVTALAAFMILRERLTALQLLGIISAFIGIVVMGFQANMTRLLQMNMNLGDFAMLGAVTFWSLYAVELHRAKYLPSYGVLLFLTACAGVIFGLPLYLIEESFSRSMQFNSITFTAVLYLSLGSTVVAVSLWNVSIRSVGANRAAIFLNLIPVFGACLAIIFLGEKLYVYHMIGGALIIFGILFAVQKLGKQSIF
jgi:drug/metabolite transporter (DMT)-like permease